ERYRLQRRQRNSVGGATGRANHHGDAGAGGTARRAFDDRWLGRGRRFESEGRLGNAGTGLLMGDNARHGLNYLNGLNNLNNPVAPHGFRRSSRSKSSK